MKIPASVIDALGARDRKPWPRISPTCVLIARADGFDELLADGRLLELCSLASQGIRDVYEAADREGGDLELSSGRVTQVVFGGPRALQPAAALRAATALAAVIRCPEQPDRISNGAVRAYAIGLSAGQCAAGILGGEDRAMVITLGGACACARKLAEIAGAGEIHLDGGFLRELEASGSPLPPIEFVAAAHRADDEEYYRIVRGP